MNKTAVVIVCASVAVISSLAFAKAPQQDTLDKRVEALEKEIVALRQRCDDSGKEVAQSRDLVDTTVKYLAAQAESAKALERALDESEKAGFTFGINPDSRKILLGGLREHVATLQKDLPKLATPAAASKKPAPPPPRVPPKG